MILRSPLQPSIGTRSSAVPWQMQATAAGLLDALNEPSAWGETLGPELVANGGFDNSLTSWTNISTGTGSPAVSGGVLTLARGVDSSNVGAVTQSVATISGRTYQLRVNTGGIGPRVFVGTASGGIDLLSLTTPSASVVAAFVATSSASWVTFNGSANNATATFDNVSVREVITGWLLPGLGGARLSGDCRTSVAMQTAADGTVGYAAHNLLTYSAGFGNAAWSDAEPSSNCTITAGQTAPDGSLAASTFVPLAGGSNAMRRQIISGVGAVSYTLSLYVKQGTATTSRLLLRDLTNAVNFAEVGALTWSGGVPVLGSLNGTWTSHSVGNGWWRVAGSAVAGAGASISMSVSIFPDSVSGTGSLLVWGAQLNLGSVALPYVPTTAAARFGPAIDWLTGIGQYGLRSEPSATNHIRNSAAVGGTSPTNWSLAEANGITIAATSAGTVGGLPGVFYRVQGTATSGGYNAAVIVETSTGIAAASGQVWAASVFAALTSGSLLTGTLRLGQWELTDVGGFVAATRSAARTVTGSLSRVNFVNTLAGGGTVGRLQPRIEFLLTNGETYDFTVFLACPQAERDFVTSPILTYGAVATRAADLLLVPNTGAGLIAQDQGTISVEAVARVVGNLGVVSINSGSAANRVDIRSNGTTTVTLASTPLSAPTVATMVADSLAKTSMSYSLRAAAASRAGSLPVPVGDAPAFTQLQLGGIDGGTTANLDGWITSVQIAQTSSLPASLQGMTA